jgi:protein-S-isoprenylcysteine O-methyltransferase Ste14
VVPQCDARFALWSGLATGLYVGVAVWGWGDASSFIAHPARLGLVVSSMALTAAAWFSGLSAFSRGQHAAPGGRWIFVPLAIVSLGMAWLPAYADRRNLGTLDGDAVRCLGLVTFLIGSVIRLLAVYALGNRFSALVAVQPNHRLKTDGLYRLVRHPSYSGALLAMAGWALVFRSGFGLVLVALVVPIVVVRIRDEERFLASEFGDEYARYRRRTWRLLPWVY